MSKIIRVGGDYTVEISGMEELQNKMAKALKVYPDISLMVLEKARRRLRKELVANTGEAGVGVLTGHLTKGYQTKMGKTVGMDAEAQLVAETRINPHFHLIEHGHRIVPRGQSKKPGHRVRREADKTSNAGTLHNGASGYHMKEKTLAEFAPIYPRFAIEAMDEILRKAGL